jgi:autotransporter-associated beta strand protein
MNPNPSDLLRPSRLITLRTLLVLGAVSSLLPAHSAGISKADNTDNLNLGSSWVGGVVPTDLDIAIWDSTVTAANVVNLAATTNWSGIQIVGPGGAVSITNLNATLLIGVSGVDTSSGSQTLTFGCPVGIATNNANNPWNIVSGVYLNGGLSGTNIIQKTGSGYLYLGNATSGAGTVIQLDSGYVQANVSSSTQVLLNGGTFIVNAADSHPLGVLASGGTEQNIGGNRTWSGVLTGSGPLTVNAASTHTWNGNNTNFAGNITEQGTGTLRLSSTNSACPLASYTVNGNLSLNQAGVFRFGSMAGSGNLYGASGQHWSFGWNGGSGDFSGVISGAPSILYKVGAGTQTLSGANTYTGGTVISNGMLQVGNGGSAGSLGTGAVSNYAVLSFNRSDSSFNFTNPISGTGSVRQDGSGTTFLSGVNGSAGANTYSGGTIVNNGTLKIAAGALGTGGIALNGGGLQWAAGTTADISSQAVALNSSAILDVNGNTVTLANAIGGGGSGSLTIKSTTAGGVLVLQGANTYTGGTAVNSGTVKVSNATGSATGTGSVTVSSGATLTGTGIIAGSVDVYGGGMLNPGASVGAMTIGSLSLESGAVLYYEFNTTPANDKVVVTSAGGLTLNGGSFYLLTENSSVPWTTAGTYQLIQYSGSAPSLDSSWTTASSSNPHIGNPQVGYTYAFGLNGSYLTLTITRLSTSVVGVWNVDANGGWSESGKWSSTPSIPSSAGDAATFGVGSALRSVALDANETVGAVTFSNANSFVITDAGKTLTLNNSGSVAPINVLNGTANAIQTSVALSDNSVVTVAAGKTLSISGAVSSASEKTLTLSGNGTLALSGNNSYGPASGSAGTLLSDGGTLRVGGAGSLGFGDVSVLGNGTLQSGTGGLTITNTIKVSSGMVATIDDNGAAMTISGSISDSGAIRKIGAGTLALSGANSYSGGTTVNGGALSISVNENIPGAVNLDGGRLVGSASFTLDGSRTVGVGPATGATGGTAVIDAAAGQSFRVDGVIGSAGNTGVNGLAINGSASDTGTVILGGENTFGGDTVISNGALQLANTLALQNSTLNYSSGLLLFDSGISAATLGGLTGGNAVALTNHDGTGMALTIGNNATSTTYSGALTDANASSGTGSLVKAGAGTLTLTGTNTYGGATAVNGGTLALGTNGVLAGGAVNVAGGAGAGLSIAGGALIATNASTIGNPSIGLSITSGSATYLDALTVASANNTTLISVTGGSLVASNLTLGRTGLSYTAQPTAGDTTRGLYITNGSVTILSNLNLGTLAAANSSVSARMDGGSLTVGGALVVGLNNGGRWSVLDINGGSLMVTDVVTGISLGGPNAGNAELLIRNGAATAGIISMGQGTVSGTSVVNITNGALYLGSGGMVQVSANVTPAITLNGGILGAAADWSSALPITLGGGAIQAASASAVSHSVALSGGLIGAGSLNKTGAGTLSLSGTNTFTGNTLVNAGILALNGLAGLSNSPVVTIASGAAVDVSGLTPSTLFLGTISNQVLTGSGTIHGSLSVGSLGIVSPGTAIGALTVDSSVTLGGQVVLELNNTNSLNSDRIVATSIAAGGILTVTNIGPALHAGDTFHLFSSAVTGAFAVTNLPITDTVNNVKYTWNNRLGVDGTLVVASVAASINPNPTNLQVAVANGKMMLSWPDSAGWILQTNAVGVGDASSWHAYPGSASLTNLEITPNPANTNVFYRLVKP